MSFMVRMSILGTLLVVALGGLAWEKLVSIPSFKSAEEMLLELSQDNIKRTAEESVTRQEVSDKFSDAPSEVEIIKPPKKKSEYEISAMFFLRYDTFHFRLMPWKAPNRIVISYKRMLKSEDEIDKDANAFADKEWVFTDVYVNQDPPPPPKPLPRDVTDRWNEMPMAAGGGGGGGKGGQMDSEEFSSRTMTPGKMKSSPLPPRENVPDQDMPSKVPVKKKSEKDSASKDEAKKGEKAKDPEKAKEPEKAKVDSGAEKDEKASEPETAEKAPEKEQASSESTKDSKAEEGQQDKK